MDGVLDLARGGRAVVDQLVDVLADRGDLPGQLVDALLAGAAGGLEARADHGVESERVVQRLGRQHDHHRRAVRVGDDALAGLPHRARVDLADDQRDVRVHAKRAGVVDDGRARGGEARRPLAAGAGAGAEQPEVEALDRVVAQRLDDEAVVERPAGAALGGEGHQFVALEPLAREAAHDGAHGTGGSDDGDFHQLKGPKGSSGRIESSPERLKAECRARTASGTRSPGTTQEMRIGLVEIISMLI